LNINYDSLLDKDIRYYNNCIRGWLKKREFIMNDNAHIGHMLAGKIAQAVWGNKDFSKPIDKVRLTKQSRKEKILETLRNKGLID